MFLVEQIAGADKDFIPGAIIDFSTFTVVNNALLDPLTKTLTNCVAPLLFPQIVSQTAGPLISQIPLDMLKTAPQMLLDGVNSLEPT